MFQEVFECLHGVIVREGLLQLLEHSISITLSSSFAGKDSIPSCKDVCLITRRFVWLSLTPNILGILRKESAQASHKPRLSTDFNH